MCLDPKHSHIFQLQWLQLRNDNDSSQQVKHERKSVLTCVALVFGQ